MLDLKNIKKNFRFIDGDLLVLNDINLTIKKEKSIAIMGESGSGKSTLLNIIGLLDRNFEGHYNFDGYDIEKMSTENFDKFRHKNVGFIFQDFKLIDQLNVIDNVMMPLTYRRLGYKYANKRVEDILCKMGIEEMKKQFPKRLSGGQKQRVAIARALVTQPRLLIADEPTGALDTKTSHKIMNIIKTMTKDYGTTIVFVTHDPKIAEYAERIVYLRDGKLID